MNTAIAAAAPALEVMLCSFKKRLYRNEENYGIALYHLIKGSGAMPVDVQSSGEFVAKGPMIPESTIVNVQFTGRWERDKQGRWAFKVSTFAEEEPNHREGIIKILSSGVYKGIGEKMAERIYDTFGTNSLRIVKRETDRLREVKGIGKATVQRIVESVGDAVEIGELMEFLAVYDIGLSSIRRILKAIPTNARQVIEQEPFSLCKIKGFGFATVDGIAAKLGTPLDSPMRIQAAVDESMGAANSKGNLYISNLALLKATRKLLNERADREQEVSLDSIKAEIQMLCMDGNLVGDRNAEGKDILYRCEDYNNERRAAAQLIRLIREPLDFRRSFSPEQINHEINIAEREFGITLSPKQREAVGTALRSKVCVITGGPGTGKTTILRFILKIYRRNVEITYPNKDERPSEVLMAPTGKAARRMSESANLPACTIHKALGIRPGEDGGESIQEPIMDERTGLVVSDESSMMDMALATQAFEALPLGAQLILIGDIDQLPSVGAGNVLAEIIASGIVPVVTLDVIYRQAETSLIVKNAHKICAGDNRLEISNASFAFFPTPIGGDEAAQEKLMELYLRAIRKYTLRETQILCPRREKVKASALFINHLIQEHLYGASSAEKITVGGRRFYVGDRIIQTKNGDSPEKAVNGDMGIILDIRSDPEKEDGRIALINFDYMEEGDSLAYYPEDFDNVQLGYAITVHKSQGSEFRAVFIPVLQSQVFNLQRNIVYTGVTRGKEFVGIIGQWDTLGTAIRRENTSKRNTLLALRMKEEYYD